MTTHPRHVVFGTGAIGLSVMDVLHSRGETVRMVNRTGRAPVPAGVEVVGGDAADPAFTTAVAKGAVVVYQTLNPPYGRWVELYTYIPDIGRGLVTLGEHPEAAGEVWHLPNDPLTRTTRQLVDLAYRQAGQPRGRVRQVSATLLRLVALQNKDIRGILEMSYLFEEPFVVDSSKIFNRLGVTATPADQALAETLATYAGPDHRRISAPPEGGTGC